MTGVVYVRIEEINRKLRMNEVVPPDGQRSPSPEPTYGTDGKRANTREVRYRQRLESERHNLISQATKIDPTFKPPIDYKRPGKCSDKVYIPDREFPEINFIGLLIGPRGNTLKKMEHDSGAKLSIRGRGSVKEGKIPTSADGIDEDLHCLITADDPEKVRKAVSMIEKIVEAACSAPEQINDLKRMQLRELAALNGTLRDEDIACSNCGSLGHRRWECTEAENLTQAIVCRICGNAGHVASDCLKRNDPIALQEAIQRNMMMDSEYANLMRELGENVPAPTMVPGMNPYGMQMALPGQAMAGMLTWAPDGAASTGAPWAMQMGGVLPPGLDAPPGVAPGQVPWTAAAYAMPPPEFGAPSAEVAAAPWHMAAGGMDMYPAPPAQPPPPPPPPRE
jgi:splicing factor 1